MSRVVLLLLSVCSVSVADNDIVLVKLDDIIEQQQQFHHQQQQQLDTLSQQLNSITEQQLQQQQTLDKLLPKLDCLSRCQNKPNILVQQNVDGSNFFNRTWSEFKAGFGNTSGNYWLGNEQLHTLTQDGKYKLRFDLQLLDSGLWYWAEYDTFRVGDESTQYTLTIQGFNGNIGCNEAIGYHNGMKFTTKDSDNDLHSGHNCAQQHGGGFWYNGCAYWHVNGAGDNFRWWHSPDSSTTLRTSRMWLVCR